jgi:PleD family two-component response regulator
MPTTERPRILIADADLMGVASLIGTLKDRYHVVTANSSDQLFKLLNLQSIDLLLLDTRLPGENPFQLCENLRQDDQTTHLPVIIVAPQASPQQEEKAFECGASDYIARPYTAPSVNARVKNQLKLSAALAELKRLNTLALDANPNTGLPGNNSIHQELERLLNSNEEYCVIYADLDHFKPYNDVYGFARGDDMIIFTANVIRVALHAAGCGNAFLGHIGGDDFMFTLPSSAAARVADDILRRIDLGISEFYGADDRQRGHIVAANREGVKQLFPLANLSLGGVDLAVRRFSSVLEMIDACTEMKKLAKQSKSSSVKICRRRG